MTQKGSGDDARLAELKAKLRKLLVMEHETTNVNMQALIDIAVEVIEMPSNSLEFRIWASGYLMGLALRVKPPGVELRL
jgi:hypothetical protein